MGAWIRGIRERGVRMRTINALMIILACAISAILLRTIQRTEMLIEAEAHLKEDEYAEILSLMERQEILTALLLLITIVMILSVMILILWPMGEYIGRIKASQELTMRGAHELRYLAQAYNIVYTENRKHNDHLLYQAEHDPLTNLFNRGAFEKLRQTHRDDHLGLMLIDVDKFKDVNDTYGHDMGDRVLKKVARLLSRNFRSSDYPCRTGGDEFAVIITDISPRVKEAVRIKIQAVSEGLRDVSEDGLPVVTLSVGVAFSDQCPPDEDLYKLADAALYRVKERGRNGFAFYDDEADSPNGAE